jgi:hypothetical protein
MVGFLSLKQETGLPMQPVSGSAVSKKTAEGHTKNKGISQAAPRLTSHQISDSFIKSKISGKLSG